MGICGAKPIGSARLEVCCRPTAGLTGAVRSNLQFVWLGRFLFRINPSLDKGRTRRTQCGLDRGTDFVGPAAAESVRAACLRESHEVDRRQVAAENRIADLGLLEPDFGQAIVL